MKRPKTIAATIFKTNIDLLLNSLAYCNKKKVLFRPIRDIYLGGLVSKVYADLENYITDSIAENMSCLNAKSLMLSRLPKEIRLTLVFTKINHDHFKNFYASSNEFRMLDNLDTQYQNKSFSWDDNANYILKYQDIIRMQGYPSCDNIEVVYHRLGITNVFEKLNKDLKRDSKIILGSVHSIRCGFVHDSQNPNLSVSDLRKVINNLVSFVMALDDIAHKHFKKIS